MDNSALDYAETYISRGWYSVPSPPRSKNPRDAVGMGWQKLRLAREDLPKHFSNGNNIGLLLGEPSNGLTDIDLDCEKAARVAEYLLPKTEMVSGRRSAPRSHFWYVCEPLVKTKQFLDPAVSDEKRAMIVEFRSTGGQTIAPPSIHETGEEYTWHGQLNPSRVGGNELLSRVQKLAAVALVARHWRQGQRHHTALALAGTLIRCGWTIQTTENFLRLVARAAGDEDEDARVKNVATTVERIKSGEEATGRPKLCELIGEKVVRRLEEWLSLSYQEQEQEKTCDTSKLVHADELDKLPRPEWLVDGQIPRRGLAVLFGPSGCGKTFLSLDYALRIAQNHNVVYIAAEGVSGLALRKNAWCEFNKTGAGGLYFYLDAIPLLSAKAINGFILTIAELSPALVVIDTLARCMAGGDENSAKDMGLLIEACARVQAQTDATVLLVHHTGKNGASERGSSALRGAADTMVELTNDDGLITVISSKTKDGRPFDSYSLRLVEHGESCVLLAAEKVIASNRLTESERKILDALAWDKQGKAATLLVRITKLDERAFYRSLASLRAKNLICQERERGPYKLTERGVELTTPDTSNRPGEVIANNDDTDPPDTPDTLLTKERGQGGFSPDTPDTPLYGVSGCQEACQEETQESKNGGKSLAAPGGNSKRPVVRSVAEILADTRKLFCTDCDSALSAEEAAVGDGLCAGCGATAVI